MSTTDYKKLADKIRTELETPLGDIDEDIALVIIEALKSQDITVLKIVKADFPTQWNKYYSKGKNGKHYWNKEGYDALNALIKGNLSGSEEL